MIAGIIIYFIIVVGILLFDGVWVFLHAKTNNKPLYVCNFMRYIRPIQLILSMFAITMLELVVQHFELITSGFVNYTTIFLGVFAVVYLVDFTMKEYKLKGYKFVVVATKKSDLKELSDGIIIKSHLDDSYLKDGDIELINSKDAKANIKVIKNYLITRVVMAVFMLIAMIASVVAVAMVK